MSDNAIDLIRELRDLQEQLATRINELEKPFIRYAEAEFGDKRCCYSHHTHLQMSRSSSYKLDGKSAIYFEWECGDYGTEMQCHDHQQGGSITVAELLENVEPAE